MADPNIYQGPGSGGTDKTFVNVVPHSVPNAGGADAGPGLATFSQTCTECAGQACWLPNGGYTITTPVALLSGAIIRGERGAVITCNDPNSGDYDIALYCTYSAAVLQSGSVAATPTLYGNTMSLALAAKPLVGQVVNVLHTAGGGSGTSQAAYIVTASPSVASPWTVTLDRPMVWPFVMTDTVNVYDGSALPQNVEIDGHGMRMAGTGLQAVEAFACRQFRMRDTHYVSTGTQVTGSPFGLDCSCIEGVVEDCSTTFTDASSGLYFQSNECSVASRFRANNGGAAINFFDCYQTGGQDCWSYNSNVGSDFAFQKIDASTFGCSECWCVGGGVINSAGSAYLVSAAVRTLLDRNRVQGGVNGFDLVGATDTTIRSPRISGVSNAGIVMDGACVRTTIQDAKIVGSAYGIQIVSGAKGTVVRGAYLSGATTAEMQVLDDCTASGIVMVGLVGDGGGQIVQNSGIFKCSDSTWSSATANGSQYQNSGGTAYFDKITDTMTGANNTAFYLTAGTTYLTNSKATGPGSSFGIYISGAATVVHIGPGCNMDGTGTALTLTGSTTLGNITMDQTGGVAPFAATASMSFAQHYAGAIEYAAGAAADGTITTYQIPGMTWVVNNASAHTLNLKTSSATTVAVTTGKKTIVYIDAAGDMVEVTSLL